jgi:quinol monooxygenase YgiN
LPEYLEETKAIFAEALTKVLKEPGCEAMYTTSIDGKPNKLIFFEIFSSEEAHKFHLEQPYTKKMLAAIDGKLAAPTVMTRLRAL